MDEGKVPSTVAALNGDRPILVTLAKLGEVSDSSQRTPL